VSIQLNREAGHLREEADHLFEELCSVIEDAVYGR
jgi:hypothetical protein